MWPATFPKPEKYLFEPLNETHLLFSKPWRIVQDVRIATGSVVQERAASAAGMLTIKGSLEYQACDDKGVLHDSPLVDRRVEPTARYYAADAADSARLIRSLPPVLLISSALFLGFLHGLGADHLMAIAALSLGSTGGTPAAGRTRALGVAVRFAVGHSLLLALGVGALIALGWSLPLFVERGGEILGGALLILFGAAGLWGVGAGQVYGHSHRHGGEPAALWHLHIGCPDHHPQPAAHSHLPTIVGAAFAVSSLRALTMLAPFGDRLDAAPVWTLLGLIIVFALGILLSMSLFGVAFARLISAAVAARLGQAVALIMAVASIGLGMFWIAQA